LYLVVWEEDDRGFFAVVGVLAALPDVATMIVFTAGMT
jgi:hypothetical protein